jgi:hypothetical protein
VGIFMFFHYLNLIMRKIILVFIEIWFTQLLFSQPYQNNYPIFTDYKDVIYRLKISNKSVDNITDLDIESVLLLDTTDIKFIEKKYPKIVKTYRENYVDVIAEKILPLKSKIIKDYFLKKDLLHILFNNAFNNNSKDKRLDHKVYIKDNKRAIYRILGGDWLECCRITITETGLYLETIYFDMQ